MQLNASQRSVLHHEAAASAQRARGRLASNRARGENTDEPRAALAQSAPRQIGSSQPSCLILNLCQTHRISIEGRPAGHLGRSPEQPRHLSGCRLRSSGISHEGYANPIMNDRPRFHSNVPVSKLTERVTRAIKASEVSSTPPVEETVDRATITKTSQPLIGPLLCAGAQGKLDSQGD